jgi:hypothetical protein
LTTGRGQYAGDISRNRINLLVVDPFYEEIQVGLFRSNTFFDGEIFVENDSIIQSVVQSTMGKKRDLQFKTYIWTQYPDSLVRSRMLTLGKSGEKSVRNAIDSDLQEDSIDSDEDLDLNSRV